MEVETSFTYNDDGKESKSDVGTIRTLGTKGNINRFINQIDTSNEEFDKRRYHQRGRLVRLTGSFISLSDSNNIRPLLDNESGIKILKNIKFVRSGLVKRVGLYLIIYDIKE